MKKLVIALVCLLVLLAAGTIWHAYRPSPPPPVTEHLPVPSPEPKIRYPVAEPPGGVETANSGIDMEQSLPELNQSDGRMREILAGLIPGVRLEEFFSLEHFIQRFVLMVDSLPRRELPADRLPTRRVPGKFLVTGGEGNLSIDPSNYRRYLPFIRLAEALDRKQVVAVYVHFYPLLQEAYVNLGYPHGYFNDRLIEVIDHLLTAPVVSEPIGLVQPKALYQFADPDLEDLSAGRKILVRTGPANAARIQEILRQFRQELIEISHRK